MDFRSAHFPKHENQLGELEQAVTEAQLALLDVNDGGKTSRPHTRRR
ncbi:hypothetical protein ACIQZB_40675 [Streptomyces sp. NPDC097727]